MSFEFYENMLVSEGASELAVAVIPERSAWVSLPPALANRLYDGHQDVPCCLEVTKVSGPGVTAGASKAQPLYVAWAGAVADPGRLAVPATLARALGLRDGERVRIAQPTEEPPPAESVSVEPADPDDWEVVELNAEHLEAVVLGQTGVAAAAQALPLWVHGTPVALRVSRTVPTSPAVRLVPGTELYVAPRPRAGDGTARVVEGGKSPDAQATAGPEQSVRCALRTCAPLPGGATAEVSPATLRGLGLPAPSGGRELWVSSRGGRRNRLKVMENPGVPAGHVALPPEIARKWGASEHAHVPLLIDLVADGGGGRAESTLPNGRRATDESSAGGDSVDGKVTAKRVTVGKTAGEEAAPAPLYTPTIPPVVEEWLRPVVAQVLGALLPVLSRSARERLSRWGAPRGGGALLTGLPGSGKSACVRALADLLGSHPDCVTHVVRVDCREPLGAGALERAFGEAARKAPSLVVLEDLDVACPNEEGAEPGSGQVLGASAFASSLADALDALRRPAPEWGWAGDGRGEGGDRGIYGIAQAASRSSTSASAPDTPAATCDSTPTTDAAPLGRHNWAPIAVLATARDAGTLARPLLKAGRLDTSVELPAPTASLRAAMLRSGLAARGGPREPGALARTAVRRIAEATDGYDAADLDTLLDRAFLLAARRRQAAAPQAGGTGGVVLALSHGATVTADDLEASREGYVPAAFWGAGAPKTAGAGGPEGWDDVGGAAEARAALHEALELPLRYSAVLAQAPLRLRTGVMLYGAPGSGKTHVIKAAIAAAGIRCISVSGPELLNKYIGASEAAVRDVFARAAAAAPSALFFDEFESLAPARGTDSTGVTDRVVNQLLTELDGVGGLKGVAVLAATSRPDLVDPALLRPGRLDRLVRCEFPAAEGRAEVLRSLSRRSGLHEDVDLGELAARTDGFSPADLAALLGEAQLAAVHEALEEEKEAEDIYGAGQRQRASAPPKVRQRHLLASLRGARPSVPPKERARLDAIYSRFTAGKGGAQEAIQDSAKRATLA